MDEPPIIIIVTRIIIIIILRPRTFSIPINKSGLVSMKLTIEIYHTWRKITGFMENLFHCRLTPHSRSLGHDKLHLTAAPNCKKHCGNGINQR